MKVFITISLLSFFISTTFGQTAEDEARVLFLKAEKAYEDKNYGESINLLNKSIDKLGNTNSKIQYMAVKVVYEGILNKAFDLSYANITILLDEVSKYFSLTDKAKADPEKYREVLEIKLDAEAKREPFLARRKIYDQFKQREQKFISDTVNRILMSFATAYNNNYSLCYTGKSKKTLKKIRECYFDSTQHNLVITNLEDKSETIIYVLKPITIGYYKSDEIYKGSRFIGLEFKDFIAFSNEEFCCLDLKALSDFNYDNDKYWDYKDRRSQDINRLSKQAVVVNSMQLLDERKQIVELKKLMDSSGFTDYFGGKYDDVKDISL
ncbi:MAG: hypothetical protein KF862_08985 [Chitinophagaceae bacterium]|nr:hypothetical protein [Chitinophagaceae bacterium]